MHKVTGLDHIGLAVRDSGKAREAFETLFGLKCTGEEVVESQKVKVVFLELGNTRLELIEPLGEGAVSKFLDKRGEGIHHICLKVDGIEEMLAEMKSKGAGLTSDVPVKGAHGRKVAFILPASANGMLTELAE
jgi:methylmalonyl-CoA/ethylmalonyl-CoA epimerase